MNKKYKNLLPSGGIEVFTDVYIQQAKKNAKIVNMMRFAEAVGALASINKQYIDGVDGGKFIQELANELELPNVMMSEEEKQALQQTYAEMSPANEGEVNQAKAQKDQADAELKRAEADQLNQQV